MTRQQKGRQANYCKNLLWILTTYDKIYLNQIQVYFIIVIEDMGARNMTRPRKQKKICDLPKINTFGPADGTEDRTESVNMSIEEYETIRLIDYENLNQEQCAMVMGVARSTVQRIYVDARKKIADSIINGKMIKIAGGDYTICNEQSDQKICANCNKHRNRRRRSGNMGNF